MTHHDLAELLRDHVSHDEPPMPLPHVALASGRRRRRHRLMAVSGASVAALVLAGALVVPRLGGETAAPGTAMDPLSAAALADYDASRMPELMDTHARRVLESTVPALGPSTFAAYDDQGQKLPEKYWDKASGLSIEFGPSDHRFGVHISHARSEAEGDPERYCESGLADGSYLECSFYRTADGDLVVSQVWALKPFEVSKPRMGWELVPQRRLDDVPLDQLYFERRVKVIKSETLITYVSELVAATDRDPARAGFLTPYDDLAAIGTDPELVMPAPPPGDNGCAAWTMPSDDFEVSCEPEED
jgi:hypothetical protein